MPELPEVETIVRGLEKKVLNRTFLDIWTDFSRIIQKPKNFEQFKKEIIGRKIEDVRRRGKNILIFLSGNKILLIHQKLTGHLLYGIWKKAGGAWKAKIPGPLSEDPANKFLHLLFFLDDGKQLALSDLRKFAKVGLWDAKALENSEEFRKLGPEPLEKSFNFGKFKERLKNKKGKVKQVLMDQNVIAGIGNIYSDEILWQAQIHPFREVKRLNEQELERIYESMREILNKAIELGGESISDYRDIEGKRGDFDRVRKVYRREGEKCSRCGTTIKRLKVGGRSAHFCPNCQK